MQETGSSPPKSPHAASSILLLHLLLGLCRGLGTPWEPTSLWGRPAAEKMGIFWPRAMLFITSMGEIPVWIISSG